MNAWKDSEESVEIIGFSILFDDAMVLQEIGFSHLNKPNIWTKVLI